MSDSIKCGFNLPAEQQAIRAKCFYPSGTFVEFSKEEIEQSIPERFEKIACRYSKQLSIKVGKTFLTYEELNEEANRIAHPILNSVGEGFDGHGAPIVTAIPGALKSVKYTCHSTGLVP
jgi:non-ribosomal peptide synthetase component F